MWNGAAPSLNAMPVTTNTRPSTRMRSVPSRAAARTPASSSVPVAPYTIDIP